MAHARRALAAPPRWRPPQPWAAQCRPRAFIAHALIPESLWVVLQPFNRTQSVAL